MRSLKFIFLLILLSAFVCLGIPAQNTVRTFNSASINNSILTLKVSDGSIIITPFSDTNIEIQFIADTGQEVVPSYAIADKSHLKTVQYSDTEDKIHFALPHLEVLITKSPFKISYFHKGELLLSEEKGFFANDKNQGFRFNLSKDEKLMGGGERAFGSMNRRGHRLQLYNKASYGYETHAELMYYSMPLIISSKKYMLGFDNGASGYLDLGATEKDIMQFEAVGGRMSYFIVVGDNWRELAVNFTDLTGRQPMLPRWALGNISSRMGYHSQQEVESIIDQYQKEDIPLDGIVLDLYWFGPDLKGHMGNLDWDRDSFPQPELMLQRNKEKGVKTILITEPFILKESNNFTECTEKGLLGTDSIGEPCIYNFFFGTTALLDIFKPVTKDWFWSIYKKHTLTGVDGWWGDLGEPEVHPDDMVHVNGRADHVHNIYGHEWAKVIHDGFEKDFSSVRPVTLMRSGFIGSQRYGLVPWSGDVSRSWGGLQSQVEIALQMGMQGLAYMHSDLGGFAGNYKDAELYTRWLQYGTFQPIYRTHAQEDVPPEPIFWDDSTKAIVRDFIKLRYKLTPYNYTLMHENSTMGIPMMRPLFYIDNNPDLINETKTYLWGDNILVSPVVEKGLTIQKVYLPEGFVWINYFTGEKHTGGQEISVKTNINTIPVFIKAGAFIPMVPAFNNMEEYTSKNLTLHYYHDASVPHGQGFIYEDDGKTRHSLVNKHSEELLFNCYNQGFLTFEIKPLRYQYEGMLCERNIELVIHDFDSKTQHISIENKNFKVNKSAKRYAKGDVGAYYNAKTGILKVKFTLKEDLIKIITE